MKTEFTRQYDHTWRLFERLVAAFDPLAWLHTGRGAIRPARLSLHILQAAKVYLRIPIPVGFASGKPFDCDWVLLQDEVLPSQPDILASAIELKELTRQWLAEMDFDRENSEFPWAGKTQLGVVLFLLHHNQFHLGELSSLLNESRAGDVEDHYVNALQAGN